MDGIADYTFVRDLGEAGNGRLFLAHTPARLRLDSPYVWLKVIGGATDEDALRRATRELRAFAAVDSPFLVRLLDAGREGSTFFYAMEHCEEGSLEEPTHDLGRDKRIVAIARAARGAHALHEAGLVHRGITPRSVALTAEGAKLADLGLALQPDASVSGLGPPDNLEYVDPAVLSGRSVTSAADIWSLGVTLHRVLTGEGVYDGLPIDNPLLAVRRMLSTSPRVAAGLTSAEADLVRDCMASDPADRPVSALVFAQRLEAAASG